MSSGRIVPWASWEEWEETYSLLLLSDDAGKNKEGIDRVAAWRCRGRVPLAVDVTAALLESRLLDRPGTPASEGLLRMSYSMAIVRLVNGVADAAQKGKFAVSVAGLSAAAGLPRVLVDIRHEATHNELPGARMLRLAASHALGWLQGSYWEQQRDKLDASRQHIAARLAEYARLQAAAEAAAASGGQAEDPEGGDGGEESAPVGKDSRKRRQVILAELTEAVPEAATPLLADALLDSGVLLAPSPCDAAAAAAGGAPAEGAEGILLPLALKHWTRLGPMLVDGAVARVALLQAPAPAEGGACGLARRWEGGEPEARAASAEGLGDLAARLVERLCPPLGEGAKAGAGTTGKAAKKTSKKAKAVAAEGAVSGGEGGPGRPAPGVLLELLQSCLLAASRTGGGGGAPLGAVRDALLAAMGAAGAASGAGAGAGDMVARAAALAHLAIPDGIAPPPPAGDESAAAREAALEQAAREQEELLASLRAGAAEAAGAAAPGGAVWALCEGWTPCAIGAVPSEVYPAGAVPYLALAGAAPVEAAAGGEAATAAGRGGRKRPFEDVDSGAEEAPAAAAAGTEDEHVECGAEGEDEAGPSEVLLGGQMVLAEGVDVPTLQAAIAVL